MAVIGNTCTAIGDVLLITPGEVLMGLTSLTGFTDVTVGTTGTRYFDKYFRYSLNGIHYSEWDHLTNLKLQAVSVGVKDLFLIEYRYVRAGADSTGELEFVSITLGSVFGSIECGFYYNRSVFKMYFDCYDPDVLLWGVNVLNKAYEPGILPRFIDRGEGAAEDKDFIDFWTSIGCYFAFFVKFAREIETFYGKKEEIFQYLTQRNIFLCHAADLADLVYIMEYFYDEIRQRGTEMIFYRKGATVSKGAKDVNGELLRLFCVGPNDEFIHNIVQNQFLGWNVGNSSPMFRGLTAHIAVNKAWENSADVIDLDKYPLIEEDYISLLEVIPNGFIGGQVMGVVDVPANTASGIGFLSSLDKVILVNPNLDYEITFWVQQVQQDANFTLGIDAFDAGGNLVNMQSITVPPGDSSSQNDFFVNQDLPDSHWRFVRAIIFNHSAPALSGVDALLNIGFGNHLRFKNDTIVKIIPKILNDMGSASPGNNIKFYDIKVRPLATPFSSCFIQVRNFIYIWVVDNNAGLSSAQKEEIIRRYLYPYNAVYTNIYIQ